MRRVPALFAVVCVVLSCAHAVVAQGPAAAAQTPPATPRSMAPFDLTGNWVSVVTEDWRWRMVVPRKGDYSSIPLAPEGRRVADTWDPEKMSADGCRPYGAAALLRVPGRLRIAWQDDATVRIDTDAGQQTRLLRFDRAAKPPAARTWQGHSAAEWDIIRQPGGLGVSLQTAPGRMGSLKVVTTHMRAGYLRANGVPYSENAVMTEYFDRLSAYGDEWLVVLTIVEDPLYLNQPFITSSHFKREPDGSKWAPAPCEAGNTRGTR